MKPYSVLCHNFHKFAGFPSGGCSEFTEDHSAQHQAAPSHVWPLEGNDTLACFAQHLKDL